MSVDTALNVGGVCLFVMGFVLWWDSPHGRPRDGQECGVRGCRGGHE